MQDPSTTPENVITIELPDKATLYAAYMPFIKNGGLFVHSNKELKLGDDVIIMLRLMEEKEKFTLNTKVVWVTPRGAQGGRVAGVGLQFLEETAKAVRTKIETYLAGALGSERRTDTM